VVPEPQGKTDLILPFPL